MKITRRKFVTHLAIVGGVVSVSGGYVLAGSQDGDWRAACKAWVKVLIPVDEFGPGANAFAVWANFMHRLDNDKSLAQMIISGLQKYSHMSIPTTEADLQHLMDKNVEMARFLNTLQFVFFESYYGTVIGWSEMGLDAPPQPKGFRIL